MDMFVYNGVLSSLTSGFLILAALNVDSVKLKTNVKTKIIDEDHFKTYVPKTPNLWYEIEFPIPLKSVSMYITFEDETIYLLDHAKDIKKITLDPPIIPSTIESIHFDCVGHSKFDLETDQCRDIMNPIHTIVMDSIAQNRIAIHKTTMTVTHSNGSNDVYTVDFDSKETTKEF